MKEGHSPIPIVACDTNLKEETFSLEFCNAKTAQSSELIFFTKTGFKKLVAQSYLV